MTLQFYLGTAAADHRQKMVAAVDQALKAGKEVFYLVPNHVKFEAEVSLLQGLRERDGGVQGQFAVSRLQVLSFSRLGWYFLKNTEAYQKPALDRASNTMLVSKVFNDLLNDDATKHQLNLFAGSAQNPGFFAELADQLAELQTGRVTADMLADAVTRGEAHLQDAEKLKELQIVAAAYEKQVQAFATPAALLDQLTRWVVDHADRLHHAAFFLDHFNNLSASEFHLVHTMLHTGADLTVALTLDQEPQAQPQGPALFLPAAKLYYQLSQSVNDIPGRTWDPVTHYCSVFENTNDLRLGVDAFWRSQYGGDEGAAAAPDADAVIATMTNKPEIRKASEPYVELRAVAKEIVMALHKDPDLRYRDFLIVARHLAPYEPYLQPVFNEQGLPVFIDRERPMENHPLIALIQSLFAVQRYHYQYEDVMKLLKTELLIPSGMSAADFREALDVTDNFLLKTGKHGDAWLREEHWQYIDHIDHSMNEKHEEVDEFVADPEKTTQINLIRDFVATNLPPLFSAWENAQTGAEGATVLYQWLEHVGVTSVLGKWRQDAIDEGDLTASTAGEQAWQKLVTLLDDYANILGDGAPEAAAAAENKFNLQSFADLLNAGFSGASYTQIPSTLDEVTVSETGLSRLAKFKRVFVIGATSTVMPDTPTDHPIITDADREALQPLLDEGAYLPESGAESALGDAFLNYLAMMAGSEKLTLSYPEYGDEENHASSYLTQMAKYFGVSVEPWPELSLDLNANSDFSSPRGMLADYMRIFELAQSSHSARPEAWETIMTALRRTPGVLGALANRLAQNAGTQNPIGELQPALAEQLYSPHMSISISQLERFYANPFEYFLVYGLKLRKRPEFELSPLDSGTLYHKVMEVLLSDPKYDLNALIKQKTLWQTVNELVQGTAQKFGIDILQADSYWQFVAGQISTMLTNSALAIVHQQANTAFRPSGFELNIGRGHGDKAIKGLEFPLEGGRSVTVAGRIDRLDEAVIDQRRYFVVLDYKSSSHSFDMLNAYYGQTMQLLTYIDAVRQTDGKFAGMTPAGAQYFVLDLPSLRYAKLIDSKAPDQPLAEKQINEARLNYYRLDGLFLLPDDADFDQHQHLISAFDQTLEPGEKMATGRQSPVFGIAVKQGGGLTAKAEKKMYKLSDMQLLLQHNEKLIKQAANDILHGVIKLAPLQFKHESTIITRSDYQAIMRFDPATGGDEYNHVPSFSQDEILARLKAEQEDNQNE
ncbi:PD-(D/E)XK nuclease family protein [Lacticaseibacillus sp. 866-1]|uniref:PD-(D/E)XK nuclease family protein n=1 Tax=Lacticaseibacillus sp. 866-1 TaxID=2799576 RepID=UPI001942A55B|nr:PD-(D/E)XK nuclease family protein [Lacticaseibacillus sp. 866-1]